MRFHDQDAEACDSHRNGRREQPRSTGTKSHVGRPDCIVKQLSIIGLCRDLWSKSRHGRRQMETIAEPVVGFVEAFDRICLETTGFVCQATGRAIARQLIVPKRARM
jgi:hypothetical protein